MKYSTNPVRGTVDYLPIEMDVRSYAEKIILETYKENGFLQIKTPILENIDLLTNGDSGDNQKLMFKTIKRGDKLDLTKPNLTEADIVEEGLRYDLTVPLVRFFSNNKEKLPYPFKAIQIDEAFRAERPQKGRVRQFTQCDIDILGDSSNIAEIELIVAGASAYQKLGFKNITFKINDRRILNQLITNEEFTLDDVTNICISLDKFDKIGMDGVKDELVNNGYDAEKVAHLIDIFKTLKQQENNAEKFEVLRKNNISNEFIDSIEQIISISSKYINPSFKIVYDASIIRGQGYYTGTVFEVYDEDFGRAIGGGGRYDKMIEKFLNTVVPAVGFSIGFYSVVMLMLEKNKNAENKKLALVYSSKNDDYDAVISAKLNLIEKGYNVSIFDFPKNFNNFVEKIKANGYNKIVKMQNLDKIIEI